MPHASDHLWFPSAFVWFTSSVAHGLMAPGWVPFKVTHGWLHSTGSTSGQQGTAMYTYPRELWKGMPLATRPCSFTLKLGRNMPGWCESMILCLSSYGSHGSSSLIHSLEDLPSHSHDGGDGWGRQTILTTLQINLSCWYLRLLQELWGFSYVTWGR